MPKLYLVIMWPTRILSNSICWQLYMLIQFPRQLARPLS